MNPRPSSSSQTASEPSRSVVSTMLQIDVYSSRPVVMPKIGDARVFWKEQASPTHLILFIHPDQEAVVSEFLEVLRELFAPTEIFVSVTTINAFKVPS